MTVEYVNITPDVDHDDPVDLYRRLGRTLPPQRAAKPKPVQCCARGMISLCRPGKNGWIKGLLPKQGVATFFGDCGSFKSFGIIDLALHIAAGERWAGRMVMLRGCDLSRV